MADTHTYNYSDIQRYLQQQMTAKEKHAFEKAMMDDPFLADALEGFKNSDAGVAGRHLLETEQRVTGTKESSKVVPMVTTARSWWRIAALFIVIAGIALISYLVMDRTSPGNEVAGNIRMKSVQPADTLKPAERTFTQSGKPKELLDIKEQKRSPFIKETSPEQIASKKAQQPGTVINEANEGLIASRQMKQPENESPPSVMQDKNEAEKDNATSLSAPIIAEKPAMQNRALMKQSSMQRFEGQVVDTKGKPLAAASILVNKMNGISTDSNGNFVITSPDSTVEVNASLVGYAPATAKISREKPNKIVLNESNLALNDVVVTGYGTRRNKTQAPYSAPALESEYMKNKVSGVEIRSQAFNEYIKAKLKYVKDTSTNYISGDVQLKFLIDTTGKPYNIKVVNPGNNINVAMKAQAIEILQNGPRWKPGKNRKAAVTIHF